MPRLAPRPVPSPVFHRLLLAACVAASGAVRGEEDVVDVPGAAAAPEAAAGADDDRPAPRAAVPPVPDGTPAELLAYVRELTDPDRVPESRGRRRYYLRKALPNAVEATDRILDATAAGSPEYAAALRLKFDALARLADMGDKRAAGLLADFAATLADSGDPELAARARAMAQRIDVDALVGRPMPIEGRLLGGGDFDQQALAGKVVLVDFWATWCGPCVAEIDTILAAYERYHDRGFEVLGISLDRDPEALERFVADRGLPWQILVDADAEAGVDAMADRYGIRGIPKCVLIGPDGVVISTTARGRALEALLADHFGDDGVDDDKVNDDGVDDD